MKVLDRKTAGILYANEYQLIDNNGLKYEILEVKKGYFYVYNENSATLIFHFDRIGTDYWILARPKAYIDLNIISAYSNLDIDNDLDIVLEVEASLQSQTVYLNFNDYSKILEFLHKNHFAINLEPEWWKPIKD